MLGVKIEGKLDTVIGPESEVKGDVSVRGGLRLDGRIEGNVSVMNCLFTGRGSFIKGEVHCQEAVIAGRVEGNVIAQGSIEVQASGAITGDVTCRNLILDHDAFLDGRVKMSEAQEPQS
jgi:cytoskeletal protein CcmA (bactofilin family)